jgi:hypothetical protein
MNDDPHLSLFWPADNPAVTTHLGLLQGIITRLANNSAACKTWCLTLVGALVSLGGATHSLATITFAVVPVLTLGFVDAMYLAQEKAYRDLYTRVVRTIRSRSYQLENAYEAHAPTSAGGFITACASWSVFPLYGGLVVAYSVAYYAGWLTLLSTYVKQP